ncbi:MAG TPA: winged helix-turn-helix domain-containing protein [bacterium]|nr:winged helix-turn-helix domain-containing protein [bacterium]
MFESNNLDSLNKFNSLENLYYSQFINYSANSFLIDIDKKIKFFEPTAELRKFIILKQIENDTNISQFRLAKNINVAPSMTNKYISQLKKNKLIKLQGKNNKTTRYYLTEKGKEQNKKYLNEFINEILILYKEIKNEIKLKLLKIKETAQSKKILLYGANEICEMIIAANKELNLKIVGIIDKNADLYKNKFHGLKLFSPDKLYDLKFDVLLITSISKSEEIYNQVKDINKEILMLKNYY